MVYTNRVEWLANYSFRNDDHDVRFVVAVILSERSNWEQMFEQNNDFTFDKPLWNGIGAGSWLGQGKAQMYAPARVESTLVGFFRSCQLCLEAC